MGLRIQHSYSSCADGTPPQLPNWLASVLSGGFKLTYTRVLSTWVGYTKADLLIKRKCLIGLTPEQQRASLNSVNSRARPRGGFGQDFFGPEQGTHFYGRT